MANATFGGGVHIVQTGRTRKSKSLDCASHNFPPENGNSYRVRKSVIWSEGYRMSRARGLIYYLFPTKCETRKDVEMIMYCILTFDNHVESVGPYAPGHCDG